MKAAKMAPRVRIRVRVGKRRRRRRRRWVKSYCDC